MPNWCNTTYAIYGNSESEIQEIKDFFDNVLQTPLECFMGYGDASKNWAGRLLLSAGIDPDNISCRGFIQYVDDIEEGCSDLYYVKIEQEDAWGPVPDVYDLLLSEHFNNYPDLGYFYIAEEPGCEVYINTDTEGLIFTDHWYVEFRKKGECIDTEYYESGEEKDMLEDINKHVGRTFESIKEVYNFCSTEEGSDWLSIHKFETDD